MLVVFLAGCTPPGTTNNTCVPQCPGVCGGDDGCGEICPCDSDDTDFTQFDCGQCKANEICLDGKCVCKPTCDGTRCDDGCGGSCECLDDKVCNAAGACVSEDVCPDTCSGLGWQCGSVCGEVCGTCNGDQTCTDHQCSQGETCPDCPLNLVLLDSVVEGAKLKSLTIALDYQPQTGESRPRLADIHLLADTHAELVDVQPGPALTQADKALFVDSKTGKPFRKRDDGAYQMLVQSNGAVKEIESGRLMTMFFKADDLGPLSFHLVKRSQVFAPFDADAPLQATAYEKPLVVSK